MTFAFTTEQIKMLVFRLLQTKEELLYDVKTKQVERYKLDVSKSAEILGVAHCDFVEDAWSYPTWIDEGLKIRAGQVDDRVGVWLLLDVLPSIPGMPAFDVLLTTDEEVGASSAQEVEDDFDLYYNWTFQFDRRGVDFVDYGRASDKFIDDFKRITSIPHGMGSFSDICYLSDNCGSRVNIGCGYHNEHSPDAWVDLKECAMQVEAFVAFAIEKSTEVYGVAKTSKGTSKGTSKWRAKNDVDYNGWRLKADGTYVRAESYSNRWDKFDKGGGGTIAGTGRAVAGAGNITEADYDAADAAYEAMKAKYRLDEDSVADEVDLARDLNDLSDDELDDFDIINGTFDRVPDDDDDDIESLFIDDDDDDEGFDAWDR